MTQQFDRVQMERQHLQPMNAETVEQMCDILISELGEPHNPTQRKALSAMMHDDYDRAKLLCLADPCDPYLAAISCISSAFRSPTIADSVLRDAARHVVEAAKQNIAARIAISFEKIINDRA